jgi:hypothetical protein
MKPGLNRRETGSAHAGLCYGLSRMKGNFHVRFLGEGVAATSLPYPTQLRRRPFISLPTRSVSLPVSERPFSALSSAHPRAICHVQTNEISGGFLELESRLFWLDTIPLHKGKAASRAMSAQHPVGSPT